jgi:ribonuclease E
VSRRLIECLSRDRTKHQVAEVTSLGLVQMTRKKLGLGLLESFSENCEACAGRGIIVHHDPVIKHRQSAQPPQERRPRAKSGSNAASTNGGSSNNSSSNNRDNAHNSAQRDGANRDAHSGSNAGSDAPKSGQGTHGITEDAKHALALIAARTITRTGSIAIVPAQAAVAANAEAATVTPPATEQASIEQASTEQASIEQASTEQAGIEQAATDRAESTGTERSRGRQSRSRGQGGRGQQSRSEQARARQASTEQASTEQAEPAASAAPVIEPAPDVPAQAPATEHSESVDILDIPVRKSTRTARRPSKQATDHLLDSVLDSLPEPKLPGQGRARSRRVTTAGGSTGQAIVTATGAATAASAPSQPPHGG